MLATDPLCARWEGDSCPVARAWVSDDDQRHQGLDSNNWHCKRGVLPKGRHVARAWVSDNDQRLPGLDSNHCNCTRGMHPEGLLRTSRVSDSDQRHPGLDSNHCARSGGTNKSAANCLHCVALQ